MAKLMPFAGTVLHNLLHKPVTTSYPDTPKEYPARTRGHVEVDMETCLLCGLCSRSCPPRAINVDRDAHTWSIHRFDCVQCGYCVEKCPKKCLKIVPGYPVPGHEKKLDIYHKPEAIEMKMGNVTVDLSKCVYCTLCAKKCPNEAITVDRANKTWEIDHHKCLRCSLCVNNCPRHALEIHEEPGGPKQPQADLSQCVFCTLCAKKCPASAITVDRANKTWTLNAGECVSCGACEAHCPKGCIRMLPTEP